MADLLMSILKKKKKKNAVPFMIPHEVFKEQLRSAIM